MSYRGERLIDAFDEERERWEIAAGRTRIMHEQAHALCGLFWAIRCWLLTRHWAGHCRVLLDLMTDNQLDILEAAVDEIERRQAQ